MESQAGTASFTLGVEEEFLLVDPDSRALCPRAEKVLPVARQALGENVQPELKLSQVEIQTPVCTTLVELRSELVRMRRRLAAAAEQTGTRVAAAGTHPFSHGEGDRVTPKPDYLALERDYQQLTREQTICGCHVHVGITDPELAVQVMNHMRPWMTPVLALAVNSPYWLGGDTGYASYRTEVWRRWPTSGTPGVLRDRGDYDDMVDLLTRVGAIDQPARLYLDVRPSAKFDTLEFRVTDVCLTIDETVMVAGLLRALARTCAERVLDGAPVPEVRAEVIRAATWRAARYGMEGELIDVAARESRPAPEVIQRLLGVVRPQLEEHEEWDDLAAVVDQTLHRGTGAARQRAAFTRRARLEDVVDLVIEETLPGA